MRAFPPRVNGDHKVDIVVATGDNTVGVLLGNGDGTFQSAVTFNSGGQTWGLVVADLNRDGKPDIVVANRDSGTVGVLLGKGDGTFKPAVAYGTSDAPIALAVGDVNNDGKLDLVVGDDPTGSSHGAVLLGNGDGTFKTSVFDAGSGSSIALADLNGDGKLDLVSTNFTSVSVALGNGDGTFTGFGGYATSPSAVVVRDVNNDGKPDLIVSITSVTDYSSAVGLFIGNGDGTFQPMIPFKIPRYGAGGLVVADVDGNGKSDVLVANESRGRLKNVKLGFLSVLLNDSGSPTATNLTTSGSPSLVHQPITFTALVTSNSGSIPDGDLVRFYDGTKLISEVKLAKGTATFTTSTLGARTHKIKAVYIGDVTLQSSSGLIMQVVQKP